MNSSPRRTAEGVLALIPARSGSKSVPGKNLRRLLGKPLIAYSIEHALQCSLVNRVIVTTDSQEIADVARTYGADVPFLRPVEIAGDYSRDVEFHHHALEWLNEHEHYRPRPRGEFSANTSSAAPGDDRPRNRDLCCGYRGRLPSFCEASASVPIQDVAHW